MHYSLANSQAGKGRRGGNRVQHGKAWRQHSAVHSVPSVPYITKYIMSPAARQLRLTCAPDYGKPPDLNCCGEAYSLAASVAETVPHTLGSQPASCQSILGQIGWGIQKHYLEGGGTKKWKYAAVSLPVTHYEQNGPLIALFLFTNLHIKITSSC